MNEIKPLPRIVNYENLGFGLFIHWGLYSQLGKGEWIMNQEPFPLPEYRKLFDSFTAENFDAPAIARLAKNAGMKYICLTTRHHEGFSLYDTRGLNNYDAVNSPAKRDLVQEFVSACRQYDIVPFFYHTTLDWFWHGKTTWDLDQEEFREYLDYLNRSVEILCRNYGRIGGFWFDGNWSRPDLDWEEDRLYGMIRRYQPEAILINNTGIHNPGELGAKDLDAVTYENQAAKAMNHIMGDRYVAGETCYTFNAHWGVGNEDFSMKSPADLIRSLCHARRVGTNFLLNVGPTAQGGIPPYEAAALNILGKWMELYGEAVYTGRPCNIKCSSPNDFVLKTESGRYFYFAGNIGIAGHENVTVFDGCCGLRSLYELPRKLAAAKWLNNGENLTIVQDKKERFATILFTGYHYGSQHIVRVAELFFE